MGARARLEARVRPGWIRASPTAEEPQSPDGRSPSTCRLTWSTRWTPIYRTRDRLAVVGALARPLVGVDCSGRVRPLKLALGDVPGRDLTSLVAAAKSFTRSAIGVSLPSLPPLEINKVKDAAQVT